MKSRVILGSALFCFALTCVAGVGSLAAATRPAPLNLAAILGVAPGKVYNLIEVDADGNPTGDSARVVCSVDLADPKGSAIRFDGWDTKEATPVHKGDLVFGFSRAGTSLYAVRVGDTPEDRLNDSLLFPRGVTIPARAVPGATRSLNAPTVSGTGERSMSPCTVGISTDADGQVIGLWDFGNDHQIALIGLPGQGLVGFRLGNSFFQVEEDPSSSTAS